MGFLGKMVEKAVVKTVEYAAINSVVRHFENTRSVDAIVNRSTANYMLFIRKKCMSIKRGFTVLDELNNIKYVVKKDVLTFGYPCIRLYDTEKHEIGKVELTSKIGMGTYAMYLDGKELGTLSRKISIKIKLDLNFNGWHLDGSYIQNSFTIFDENGNRVIKFNKAFTPRDTYVLEMNNREHEILGLLLLMAVEIALHKSG